MTRQDFELIARVIREWQPTIHNMPEWVMADIRHTMASAMADSLAATNPRFNRDRFITAATGGN